SNASTILFVVSTSVLMRGLPRGFLPLAFDSPVSYCKAAALVLVRPGYFISPVPAIS
ncbi:hypothetical protein L9F63_010029, partial [Diploptera punctata]